MSQDYSNEQAYASSAGGLRVVGQTVVTWVGAVVAMILLLGLGTWFYQLGVRDAQDVPIIRASTAPVKTRPENAGGEVTPHQDIASYDAASGQTVGEAAPVLAPPPPEPTREDVAVSELTPEPEPTPVPVPEPTPAVEPPTPADPVAEASPPEEPTAQAPVEAPAEPEEVAETPPPTPPPGAGSDLAPAFSPPLKSRPRDLRARMEAAKAASAGGEDQLAAAASSSRFKVQLRASPDRASIVSFWGRVQAANRDILGQKALVVQTTTSGGTTFYRLRVGPFANRAEANAVCQALRARNQDCIVAIDG